MDQHRKEALYEQWTPLVFKLARQFACQQARAQGRGHDDFDVDEYVGLAFIGLVKAIESWDPARARFISHAWNCISNELRWQTSRHRRPSLLAEDYDVPLHPAAPAHSPELIGRLPIDRLTDAEHHALRMRLHGATYKEVAAALGVSKQRANQVVKQASQKLGLEGALQSDRKPRKPGQPGIPRSFRRLSAEARGRMPRS